MSVADIEFRETKDIPAEDLRQLFLEEEWNDFMDQDEVIHHLQTALFVVSAWRGDDLIGYARLEGDGRIWVEISEVLVKEECQGQGIGTELVRRVMDRIDELKPCYVQVAPIEDRDVHLYEKFGFSEIQGYRRMEARTDRLRRKVAEVRCKKDS